MEPTETVYEITRHYLQDRKTTLPSSFYNWVLGNLRARRYDKLAACATSSLLDVTCRESMRTALQIEAFFKKNAVFTETQTSKLAALLTFEEGERLCEATNERLDQFSTSPSEFPEKISRWVKSSEKFIDRLLGSHTEFLEVLPKLLEVTAGATATRSRRNATPFLKINKKIVCTPGAIPYITTLSKFFGYGDIVCKLISRNRVVFVPKSWKTARTIACEAEGNMPLQLAFDKYAKRRLIRVGINLSDQTRNQELAREGSINGKLATIDLSMASDTLSFNTVALLLPGEWFRYLRSIRSQYYEMYPSHREAYHKFSSMGNGATFALETLIFAAACYSVGGSTFSVYGDDIIINSEKAEDLLEYLAFLGFVPNVEKTFTSGPIRESCGAYWHEGYDILPVYIRELDRRKTVQCHLINTLMTISEPYGNLWNYLVQITKDWRLPFVPMNESSISGVWIHPHHAYARNLISTKLRIPGSGRWVETHIPRMRAFVPTSRIRKDYSIRSLFLWYLGTMDRQFGSVFGEIPDNATMSDLAKWRINAKSHGTIGCYESSWYATSSHKYRRKWVHWNPVVNGPDHLYEWSEEFVPAGESRRR